MKYPVFIYHELVFRCAAINKSVGKYISTSIENGDCLIRTSTGHFKIAKSYIDKQYTNPKLISDSDLAEITASFKFS